MRTLHELPKFQDRWSYLYLEHGVLNVDSEGLKIWQKDGVSPIPVDQLAVVMLGPGTSVTHAAVKSLAENNCLVAWTGEGAVRLYAASTGGTFSSRRTIRQAALVTDETTRAAVAHRMYRLRFDETLPDDMPIQELRGREGIRVRRAYERASKDYGVEWKGRNYDQGNWGSADPVNRALSAANSCLYGVCHAAILSAGYSPALGFIHTGKMLSFVYDVADLYKTEVTIPVAFKTAAQNPPGIEGVVRRACRDLFFEFKLMERIIPDIAEVLDAGDDLAENPGESEGRIVTLADRTTPWGFPGESDRQGAG